MELNKIYNQDCLVGMRDIPDRSIDAIICDLPYGTTRNKWDNEIPFDKLWEQYKRVIKDNGAIVLFAQTPFDKVLGCSNMEMLRYEWIWIKENGTGFLNANRCPLKIHENILVFGKKQLLYNPQMGQGKSYRAYRRGNKSSNYDKENMADEWVTENKGTRYPKSVLEFSRDKQKLHPTQKPVALIEYLIRTYTNEGGVVLDNCMGSGTTAIACINTNRNFIGFEMNKEYWEIANKRIEERLNQPTLF